MARTFRLGQLELEPDIKDKSKALHFSQKYHDLNIFGMDQDTDNPVTASRFMLGMRSPVLEQTMDGLPSENSGILCLNEFRSEVIQRAVELIETGETSVQKEDVADFHHFLESMEIKGVKDINADVPQLITLENGKTLCEICGSQFTQRSNAKTHHLLKHASSKSEKNLKCPFCPQKFHVKLYLNQHIGKKHGIKPSELTKGKAKAIKKLKIEKEESPEAANFHEEGNELIETEFVNVKTEPIANQANASEARLMPPPTNRKRKTERPAKEPKGKSTSGVKKEPI